ncbi:MAG: NAD(P)-dependent alcohol dehydrogenase [Candidatus Omnitrophica bacterium]|nr:NAD(P)-dependent alcohol dehydrogenase [Candidatus Omnitrophota bacterium]
MTKSYGTENKDTPLSPFQAKRRDPGPSDVQIDILFCGVCHSDIHQARNEWHNTTYPCVPGHEIIGKVTKIGNKVKKFKIGDIAGVGCLVDSCRDCQSCKENLEQHCENGAIFTYNSPEKHIGGMTFGGYSQSMVVDEDFVLNVPKNLDLAAAAPLLCAGITTYSPLRRWKVGKGQKVGIVGLGGLGHMGIKFANAFGSHVVLFTTSEKKKEDAKRLGAHDVVISTNAADMTKHTGTFDFILDTVCAQHDINAYLGLLKRSGTMTLVGAPEKPLSLISFNLIMQRRHLAGSLIGGLKETQEMLDFCGKHNIVCDIEKIPIQKINEAYDRILKSDVKYRFVIDIASLK